MLGRPGERAAVDGMLDAARVGRSSSLLVEGEPGMGKTCLCDYARTAAVGFATVGARGVETECLVSFSALGQLLHPLRANLAQLPPVQRRTLGGVLALEEPAPAPPLALGAAALALLASAAEDRPLLVIADDLHWFDPASAQATGFVARRLDLEGIALLATRRSAAGWPVEIDPRMSLTGLAGDDAVTLVREVTGIAALPAVVDALVDATGGNPLALRNVAEELSPKALVGAVPLPDPLPLPRELGAAYRRRIAALPRVTRAALVVLAAAATSARVLLEPALALLGLEASALGPAEAAGMVSLSPLVAQFSHPLVRSAAYHAADPPARRAAHRALAEAAERTGDLERQAWHLAAAATGPDEAVAAALERASERAARIGGAAAAAPGLDRAAQLTPPGDARARRLVAAASAFFVAGNHEDVTGRLDEALRHTGDVLVRADAARLRAQLLAVGGHSKEAVALVRAEARAVAPYDKRRAAHMLCEMSLSSVWDGRVETAAEVLAEAAPLAREAGGLVELLAENYGAHLLIFRGDMEKGASLLRDVDARWRAGPPTPMVPWPVLGFICIEDLDRAEQVLVSAIGAARAAGALAALPYNLGTKAELDFITGDWLSSYATATECVELAVESGQLPLEGYGWAGLTRVEAGRGREEACRAHAARANEIADGRGGRYLRIHADGALGLLGLGLGRPHEARTVLAPLLTWLEERRLDGLIAKERIGPDLIEATLACGQAREAEQLLASFEAIAVRTGRTWARAAALRCRAMLAPDDEAEALFGAALALHLGTRTPFEQARTELVFGEWLHGVGRRTEGDRHLRSARLTFDHLGAVPWSERASRHLGGGAVSADPARPAWVDDLTPQELRVALAVAEGASNKEVATALFLSPRTVESHLSRVYRKAGMRSRSQLTRALAAASAPRDPLS